MRMLVFSVLLATIPVVAQAERIGATQCRIDTPAKVQDAGNFVLLKGPNKAFLKCPFTESMKGYTIYYNDQDGKAGNHSVKAVVQDLRFVNPGVNLDLESNFHPDCDFASNLKTTSEPAIGPANVVCPFTVPGAPSSTSTSSSGPECKVLEVPNSWALRPGRVGVTAWRRGGARGDLCGRPGGSAGYLPPPATVPVPRVTR